MPKPAGTPGSQQTGAQPIARPPGRQTGSVPVARIQPTSQRTTAQGIAAQRQSDRVPAQRTTGQPMAAESPPFHEADDATTDSAAPVKVIDTPSSALRHEDLFGDDDNNLAAADNAPTVANPTQARKETEFDVTTNPTAKPLEPELPSVPVVRFSKTHQVPSIPETAPPTTVPPPMVTRAPSIPPQNLLRPKSPSQMPLARVTVKSNRQTWMAVGIGVAVAVAAGTVFLVLTSKHATDAGAHVTATTTPAEPVITTGTV
ncbi:MAG TPA: hypothetical protein VLT45_21465, partial [Kofleriaceae bacterium]|nr:hypothetical protein [Kofleriaceae bacterium]